MWIFRNRGFREQTVISVLGTILAGLAAGLAWGRDAAGAAVLCSICVSAGVCCLVGVPVSERSWGSRLIEIAGPPTGSPFSSASFSLP